MNLVHDPGMATRKPGRAAPDRNRRRRERTRARLLAAARHLFATQGFEVTTIAEIADRADMGIGSFYNYFPTKDEMLAALLEEAMTLQLHRLQARQEGLDDPAERVSVAHRHLLLAHLADPDWGWLLVRLQVPHRVTDTVLGKPARRDLRDGIAAGRFHVSDPDVALQASGGALIGVMHALLRGELGEDAGRVHAEGVLRSFGLDRTEAAEIAARPLPAPVGAPAEPVA